MSNIGEATRSPVSKSTMTRSHTIEIVSPSGYPPDMAAVERGVARLRAQGHRVSGEEVAARLNISLSAMKSRLHRARLDEALLGNQENLWLGNQEKLWKSS